LQRGNLAFQEGVGFGQFAAQPGLEPLRLTVILLGLSFYQAGPLLDGTQFGLRFGQIGAGAPYCLPLGSAGWLIIVPILIVPSASATRCQCSLGLGKDFLSSAYFVAPVVQPLLQPIQRAADFDFGSVEDFLRLRVEAGQMSLELF